MKQETQKRYRITKSPSKYAEGVELLWCLPRDYYRIKQLKENKLPVSSDPVPGSILKQFDILAQVWGI